jgi:hypothetical protein
VTRMAAPTTTTDKVAHAAVGVGAAIVVPLLVGKGRSRPVVAGIAGAVLHMLLDAPLAKVMANHRLQF